MTRYEVTLSPDAEAEIREAFLWYYARSPLAADAFRTEVFEAIDSLTASANMWPEDEEGIRYYELDGLAVTVLAVAHQRRRPGYWQER